MRRPLVSLVVLSILVPGHARAQDAKQPAAVKERLAHYKKLIREKEGAADHVALGILDELLAGYPKMEASDKKRFVAGIAEALSSPKVKRGSGKKPARKPGKPPAKGNDELYRRVARALGKTGKLGSPRLRSAFEGKKFKRREWDSLRGDFLEQLGVGKDPRSVELLLKTARRSESDTLRSKAGFALRHYADAKLALRKEICKDLIREWINIHSNAYGTTDPDRQTQRFRSQRRLSAVSSFWNQTLQKLTRRRDVRGPQKWQDFYNSDDWKKNWDKAAVGSAGKRKSRSKKRR